MTGDDEDLATTVGDGEYVPAADWFVAGTRVPSGPSFSFARHSTNRLSDAERERVAQLAEILIGVDSGQER
jgi:hypothetical protein